MPSCAVCQRRAGQDGVNIRLRSGNESEALLPSVWCGRCCAAVAELLDAVSTRANAAVPAALSERVVPSKRAWGLLRLPDGQ